MVASTGDFPSPAGFEVLEQVGQGGMGTVYRATDLSFDRDVALKFLLPKFGPNSIQAERFLYEARVTARLQHPGIPAVHQVGRLADGRPYLAMKLIRGEDLAKLLSRRSPEELGTAHWLSVFESVCHAMGAAHAAGFIHRDLKPGNVMVGAFGEVQVMDWGLAKNIVPSGERLSDDMVRSDADVTFGAGDDTASPGDPNGLTVMTPRRSPHDDFQACESTQLFGGHEVGDLTQAGTIMGTPSYMSPEQARGEIAKLDARSDVFSLGAILCEILTGKPPLEGASHVVLHRVQSGDFKIALDRLERCGADRPLIELCRRCLNPEADQRPADASEVAEALAGIRAESESKARLAEVRAVQQKTRQKVGLIAGGIVFAVLLAGVVGVSLALIEAKAQEARARTEAEEKEKAHTKEKAERERAESATARAEKAHNRVSEVLDAMISGSAVQSLGTQATISEEQKKFLSEVLGYYREILNQGGEEKATRERMAQVATNAGRIQLSLGLNTEAEKSYQLAAVTYERLSQEFPEDPLLRQKCGKGRYVLGLLVWKNLNLPKEALGDLIRAEAIQRKLAEEHPKELAFRVDYWTTLIDLGDLQYRLGQRADAKPKMLLALEGMTATVRDHPAVESYRNILSHNLHALSALHEWMGQLKESEDYLRQAMEHREKLVSSQPKSPGYQHNLANNYIFLANLIARSARLRRRKRSCERHCGCGRNWPRATRTCPSICSLSATTGSVWENCC